MTTFLGMVQGVYGLLRSERPTAISSTDPESVEVQSLIHRASREVFDTHPWSFLPRRDGRIRFYGKKSGTAATTTLYSTAVGVEGENGDETDLSHSNLISRLALTGDTNLGSIAWRLAEATYAGSSRLTLTLEEEWLGDVFAANGAWDLFAAEAVLPADVSQVLSVYDENQPLRLEEVNRDFTFDGRVPRIQDAFGTPEVVYVGGVASSTIADRVLFPDSGTADQTMGAVGPTGFTDTDHAGSAWTTDQFVGNGCEVLTGDDAGEKASISANGGLNIGVSPNFAVTPTTGDTYQIIQSTSVAAVTGITLFIWPIPSDVRMLRYSYAQRLGELALATDTWDAVPDHVSDLIVRRAFAFALSSNIESNPELARQVIAEYAVDLERAIRKDRVQPSERRVVRDVFDVTEVHPNARWASRTTS